jgi:hypothetical protein
MKRYLALLGIAALLGLAGWMVSRSASAPPPGATAHEPAPAVTLDITVTPDEHIVPAVAAVPKDHLVRLRVTNRHRRAVTLTLMGYQDRFGAAYVLPDSVWQGEFLADRPGDGFAWMLEGAPVGRLDVTGSHLVDGHR